MAAKEAVSETFLTLGMDISNPISVQGQFAFLRHLHYAARHARSWAGRVLPFALAAAMVATVAFSRMYLGVHYLSDVLAALAEACGWLAICITGAATFERRRRARERAAGEAVEPQEI